MELSRLGGLFSTAKMNRWAPVLILAATFLVFSPTLRNEFVNWEDDVNVTENPFIKQLNAENIKGLFKQTITGGYRPLATLTYAVEHHFFGLNPLVYHLNNILLHLLCTLLFYVFLRRMGASLFISFCAAMLFGIHPMRVESVAWVTERKDVLYSLFFLLSMILYLQWYRKKRLLFYLLALAAFILALLSKIQAVALPVILLLMDYYHEKRFSLRQLIDKTPFLILSLATGILGIFILGSQGTLITESTIPGWQRIFIGTYSLCVYLVKSVFPYQLSAIYPNPASLSLLFYLSAAAVLVLAAVVWRFGKSVRELVFGSLFFLVNIVFVLQVLGAGQAFLADRFTYLAYGGLFFLIAWGLNFLMNSRVKPFLLLFITAYLIVLGAGTWDRVKVWRTSESLFTDVIRKFPDCSIAHNNLGLWYRDRDQNEKALESYTRAIQANPAGHLSYSNRGETWFALGEIDKALVDMNIALRINPDYGKALSNRGAIRGARKEYDLALSDLDKAIQLDPKSLQAYQNRVLVHYALGNFEMAAEDCTSFLRIEPYNPDILNHRGLCYDRLNRNEESLNDFNLAIQLNPSRGNYFRNRSYLLAKVGDYGGALRDILNARQMGISINPDYLRMLESR
jgi:tetratricopeptide (TPR) repeat protein